MRTSTTTRRLVDTLLGGTLDEYVRTRRNQTPARSWRLISLDLLHDTGEDVTFETLRSWFPEYRNPSEGGGEAA